MLRNDERPLDGVRRPHAKPDPTASAPAAATEDEERAACHVHAGIPQATSGGVATSERYRASSSVAERPNWNCSATGTPIRSATLTAPAPSRNGAARWITSGANRSAPR